MKLIKEIIEAFEKTGLFFHREHDKYFSHAGCDVCTQKTGERLGNDVYIVKGYTSLAEAKQGEGNLYTLDICHECLYEMLYWEANLRGANLRGADLRGADLRGADLRGADLR